MRLIFDGKDVKRKMRKKIKIITFVKENIKDVGTKADILMNNVGVFNVKIIFNEAELF
jgi:hypothetical protein